MSTAAELPVAEARWLTSLRAEATALGRTNPARLRRAGVTTEDLVQEGALGYLRALARADTRAVTHRHAFAMAAARGAMRDAVRSGEAPAPVVSLEPSDTARVAAPRRAAPTPSGLRAFPRWMRRRIARLPAAQQEVLRLTLQGRGPQEIARTLGATENTIALRKHRAVTTLRAAATGRAHVRRGCRSVQPTRT